MPININLSDSLEKIPVEIFKTPQEGSQYVANIISVLIKEKNAKGKKAVIGLATGSTPKSLYAELVRMHNEEGLSFKNVITFNLDQYYPMEADALNSYHYFMRKYLFEQTDIDPKIIFYQWNDCQKKRSKNIAQIMKKRLKKPAELICRYSE